MKTEILNWCKEHKVITIIAVIMLLGVGYLSTIDDTSTDNNLSSNQINEDQLQIGDITYTIESLSNKINSSIGETYQMYRVNTDIKNENEDKSYIILNFLDIKKYSTYDDFNNVVVLQTITNSLNTTNYLNVKKFLDEASYFELYDEFGNSTLDITSYIRDKKDFTEILLEIDEDINKYKYLKIGGIDKERNNNLDSLVFEIEEEKIKTPENISTNVEQSPTPSKTEDEPEVIINEVEASEEIKSTTPSPIEPETESEPISSETLSQKNAVRSAKSYLGYSGFSYDGLVAQLEYEQFSNTDAIYGVNNSDADWNEQAVKVAKSYIDYSAFSKVGLIEQLKYDKFTQAQAEYGVNNSGADWNEQAVKAAQSYIDYSAFSRDGLIEQLKYDNFTQSQAEYGVNAVGL